MVLHCWISHLCKCIVKRRAEDMVPLSQNSQSSLLLFSEDSATNEMCKHLISSLRSHPGSCLPKVNITLSNVQIPVMHYSHGRWGWASPRSGELGEGRRGLWREAPDPAKPPPWCPAPCQNSWFPGIAANAGCELRHKCVCVLNGLFGLESALHPCQAYRSALTCPVWPVL